jgi:hypothetical protein
MKGCFRWFGIALVLGLLFGAFFGTALYVDVAGITTPAMITEKRETIRHTSTGGWVRDLTLLVRYQPYDETLTQLTDIRANQATYDRLHVGATVPIKYAPSRVLRDLLILPATQLADQSTLDWLLLQYNASTLRNVGLALLGVVLFCFWLITPAGKSAWWRVVPLLIWGIAMMFFALRPTLIPAPAVPQRLATAIVKDVDRITLARKTSRSSLRYYSRTLLQPYDLVQLEWTPPGMDTPVQVVDEIDPESITDLKTGSTVAISYRQNDPRAAQLVGGTRSHQWINYLTLPVNLAILFGLWLLWKVITLPFRKASQRLARATTQARQHRP